MELVTQDDIDMILRDQQGNNVLDVISGAIVTFDAPYGDPTGVNPPPPPGMGTKELHVPLLPDGEYSLEVSGVAGSDYSIAVYSSTSTAETNLQTLSGVIKDEPTVQGITFSSDGEVGIEIEAMIDVSPWSRRNIIIPHKWFPVFVAILGTDTFDPAKVDRSSLTFGKTGDEESLRRCFKRLRDVNRDGKKDLICRFAAPKTGLTRGDTEAMLKGNYEGNLTFTATDKVKIFKPWFLR